MSIKGGIQMAKMGRPVCGDPSIYRVGVRLTEKEYQRLKAYADATNQTMSQAVKEGIELVCQSKKS